MKVICNITEDEMIATFLPGELTSMRFGGAIREQLASRKLPESVVADPDLNDAEQSEAR